MKLGVSLKKTDLYAPTTGVISVDGQLCLVIGDNYYPLVLDDADVTYPLALPDIEVS